LVINKTKWEPRKDSRRKGSGLIMKKTLVALAVLAAGSVNAAEVYNNDGVSTTLSGVAEVQFIGNQGYADADLAVRIDDFDLTAATAVALSEDLSAIGAVSLASSGSADRTYVGFASAEMGTLTVGQQTLISDDAGIGADYEFGGSQYGTTQADGTDVVKYVYDNGQFFFGISQDVAESDTDESSLDGRIGVRADALEVALYAYSSDDNGDESAYNLQATYAMDAFGFAASLGSDEVNDAETTFAEANVTYTLEATTYALGFSTADPETGDSVDTIYANLTTKLAPSVKVYAEAGYQADAAEEFGYVAGMEVKF
jgi:predicted porin